MDVADATGAAAAGAGKLGGGPCAVCFEDVGGLGAALPCACTATYCAKCWDRSLAHSLNASGAARCPTCRSTVHVEFDARAGRLVFSVGGGPGVAFPVAGGPGVAAVAFEDDDAPMAEGLSGILAREDMEEEELQEADEEEVAMEEAEEEAEEQGPPVSPASRGPSPRRRRLRGPPPPALENGRGGRLSFGERDAEAAAPSTPAPADPPGAATSPTQWRGAWPADRLLEQARPVQIALLRRHGEAHPPLRRAARAALAMASAPGAAPGWLPPWEPGQPVAVAPRPPEPPSAGTLEGALGQLPALSLGPTGAPPCACGGSLTHVTYRERLASCLRMKMPASAGARGFEELVDNVLGRREACYFCDLCGLSRAEGGVWTCENGNNTILHANAYDVCELCFAFYSGGEP